MNAIDILDKLPQLFRSADLSKFTGNSSVFLTRALRRGLITRFTRGIYFNTRLKGVPSLEEAACFVRSPSYISAEWALHLHGIILQVPTICTVITLSTAVGAARTLSWQGVFLEYSHISNRLYFGFEPRDGYNLAHPEKALLDAAYFRNTLPFEDELELEDLDFNRLLEMSKEYPARVRKMAKVILNH